MTRMLGFNQFTLTSLMADLNLKKIWLTSAFNTFGDNCSKVINGYCGNCILKTEFRAAWFSYRYHVSLLHNQKVWSKLESISPQFILWLPFEDEPIFTVTCGALKYLTINFHFNYLQLLEQVTRCDSGRNVLPSLHRNFLL